MIIVYLAIILVVLGFIFVITSVEVRKETIIERVGPSRGFPETAFRGPDKSDSGNTESPAPHLSDMFKNENSLEIVTTEISEHEMSIPQENPSVKSLYDVTLYVDENSISFESGQIDPASLKRVIREGSGTAEISPDALMIRIGKKLFRYDYYRLDKVEGAGESVLLSVRGSSGVTIVIADDPSFFPRVSSEYSLFVSR
jgi:hypothetical protein